MIESTMPRSRRRPALVSSLLVATLAAVTLSVPQASAVTPWQNFGSGSARGRGEFGDPSLRVESTTKQNPTRVRFVVSGRQIRTDISWDIFCFNNSNFRIRTASGSLTKRLPFTKDISNGSWVSNFQFCELSVSAFYFDTGQLSVKLQARYP